MEITRFYFNKPMKKYLTFSVFGFSFSIRRAGYNFDQLMARIGNRIDNYEIWKKIVF